MFVVSRKQQVAIEWVMLLATYEQEIDTTWAPVCRAFGSLGDKEHKKKKQLIVRWTDNDTEKWNERFTFIEFSVILSFKSSVAHELFFLHT